MLRLLLLMLLVSGQVVTDAPEQQQVSRSVRELVERLVAAVREEDRAAFLDCFDEDGQLDRIGGIAGTDLGPLARMVLRQEALEPVLSAAHREWRVLLGSSGEDVRLEQDLTGGRRSVVLRMRQDGVAVDHYLQFTLATDAKSSGDEWRVIDFEFEDAGVSACEQMALPLVLGRQGKREHELFLEYAGQLQEALNLQESGDASAALLRLQGLEELSRRLPPQILAVYWRHVMGLAFEAGEYATSANAAAALGILRPTTPISRFYLGRVALRLGKPVDARMQLETYQRLVGSDGASLAWIGDSHALEGDLEKAISHWRSALDQNSELLEPIRSLGAHLPADRMHEVVASFRALQRPAQSCEALLSSWLEDGLCDPIEALSAARREDEPRDANAYYYAGACALRAGDFERAQKLALAGREYAPSGEVLTYDRLWLEAAWSTGDPLEAYRGAPDKAYAFDYIGEQLVFGSGDLEQLLALITLRVEDDDQDVWIPYYRGQAFTSQGQYEEADDQFRIGLTHALESEDADRAAAYRLARTDNAYAGGSGAAAYQQMPDSDVYARLLELVLTERDGDTLAELIALRKERVPDDPQLGFWLAHALIISGQEDAGLQRLLAKRGDYQQDEALRGWLESDLVRANVRLRRFEKALTHAQDSTRRDGNPYYEFIVQVARGNVQAAETIFLRLRELGYGQDLFYEDREIGKRLREDARFANFRLRWPQRGAGSASKPDGE